MLTMPNTVAAPAVELPAVRITVGYARQTGRVLVTIEGGGARYFDLWGNRDAAMAWSADVLVSIFGMTFVDAVRSVAIAARSGQYLIVR